MTTPDFSIMGLPAGVGVYGTVITHARCYAYRTVPLTPWVLIRGTLRTEPPLGWAAGPTPFGSAALTPPTNRQE